jgi:hypothetical protein
MLCSCLCLRCLCPTALVESHSSNLFPTPSAGLPLMPLPLLLPLLLPLPLLLLPLLLRHCLPVCLLVHCRQHVKGVQVCHMVVVGLPQGSSRRDHIEGVQACRVVGSGGAQQRAQPGGPTAQACQQDRAAATA